MPRLLWSNARYRLAESLFRQTWGIATVSPVTLPRDEGHIPNLGRFCRDRQQAGTLDSSKCSPEGERYKMQSKNPVSGNEVRACAVGIGFLVGLVHLDSRSPEAGEKSLAGQSVRTSGVHVEQVHEA